jgi:hypothetical protein
MITTKNQQLYLPLLTSYKIQQPQQQRVSHSNSTNLLAKVSTETDLVSNSASFYPIDSVRLNRDKNQST